nr:hypothetical protein [Methylobacterium sp.]
MTSADFDARRRDPLDNLMLKTKVFAWATGRVTEVPDRCCEGRIVSLREGGYDLQGLGRSVVFP